MTPKQFEKVVKKRYEALGYQVMRTDFKNKLPDFLIFKKGETTKFIEVKNYRSCKSVKEAYSKWKKAQKSQYKSLIKINEDIEVRVCFNLSYGYEDIDLSLLESLVEFWRKN